MSLIVVAAYYQPHSVDNLTHVAGSILRLEGPHPLHHPLCTCSLSLLEDIEGSSVATICLPPPRRLHLPDLRWQDPMIAHWRSQSGWQRQYGRRQGWNRILSGFQLRPQAGCLLLSWSLGRSHCPRRLGSLPPHWPWGWVVWQHLPRG